MSRSSRFALLCATLAGALLACGGGQRTNHYRGSVTKAESCCEGLADPSARDACLADIPRVDSAAAETAPTNQETFRCVNRYFICDSSTGRATRESAQAQLDCLNSLESTQQMQ
jgi:hypothetical protein